MVVHRVLELFSGIGGMHAAVDLLQKCNPDDEYEVVAAIDINTTANTVYRFNHPSTTHWQRNITGINAAQINKLSPDILLMSPPCQPHTRQGKQQDKKDPRSEALKHILTLIPQIQTLKYILLENVKGFEVSEARSDYIRTVSEAGFQVCEFLINPVQIGIPNSRLRYYGLARRVEDNQLAKDRGGADQSWPLILPSKLQEDFSLLENSILKLEKCFKRGNINDFLQVNVSDDFLLEDKILLKYRQILDIVKSDSQRSCCFTKAYGQYFEGTGSVLQQGGDVDAAYVQADLAGDQPELVLQALSKLKMRLFTGYEIAALLGFPAEFKFPEETSRKQEYRTLGNSLNVNVVAILVHFLIS